MIDTISRQAALEALLEKGQRSKRYKIGDIWELNFDEIREAMATVPSAQGYAEFINWLLDEIWDDEMWELNYRAFPELLCRRLVKAGWLKEENGKYIRLDNQITVCPMCPDCPDNCPLETEMDVSDTNVGDTISRQAAIDAIADVLKGIFVEYKDIAKKVIDKLPSAHPEINEWCTDCKEYDHEHHCCPRFNRVIREAAEEVRQNAEPGWIPVEDEPPKEKNRYWVCTDTGYQCECRWTNNVYGLRESDNWGWSIFDIPQYSKVVAYMPLPEPYKEKTE